VAAILFYIYIKGASTAKDVREAFYLLYLGANNVDNVVTAAEEQLQSTRYSGDKRNFDFEKFVWIHTEQHSVLNDLMEHGYSGIDESSKVRLLLDGITVSNYDVVKSQMLARPALETSFEKYIELYNEFIKSTNKEEHHNVSEVHVKSRQNGKSGGDAGKRKSSSINGAPEDKFYSREQYMSLYDDQKEALRQKHLARVCVPNGKKGKTVNNGAKSNIAVIAALAARRYALVAAKENEVQGTTEGTGNHNNDVLLERHHGPGK
jgi:hypothetical protein